jgi:hypothetical protein
MRIRPRSLPVVFVVLLFVGLGVWWWLRAARLAGPSPVAASSAVSGVEPAGPPSGPGGVEPAYSPLADELHSPRHDAAHDLVVLRGLLAQFTTSLKLAERPPLGDNADIAAALGGANRRRLVFIPPRHPALREGRLVDRHGTPYHFHARSADAIDARSAGPDRRLFTADDLVAGGAGADAPAGGGNR